MNLNKGKIAIFIDGNNLFHLAQQLNIEIDYTKLLKFITNQHPYFKAYFYGIQDSNNDKQLGFYTWLKYNGYKVITKSYYQFNNNSNNDSESNEFNNKESKDNKNKKQSLDVEIVTDLFKYIHKYDTAIIVGGNTELLPALHYLNFNGIRIEWYNLKSFTSNSILDSVDHFVDLFEIKVNIEKQTSTPFEKYSNILSSLKNN
jgi:uncharacterized LabA/DUF88 family protein